MLEPEERALAVAEAGEIGMAVLTLEQSSQSLDGRASARDHLQIKAGQIGREAQVHEQGRDGVQRDLGDADGLVDGIASSSRAWRGGAAWAGRARPARSAIGNDNGGDRRGGFMAAA